MSMTDCFAGAVGAVAAVGVTIAYGRTRGSPVVKDVKHEAEDPQSDCNRPQRRAGCCQQLRCSACLPCSNGNLRSKRETIAEDKAVSGPPQDFEERRLHENGKKNDAAGAPGGTSSSLVHRLSMKRTLVKACLLELAQRSAMRAQSATARVSRREAVLQGRSAPSFPSPRPACLAERQAGSSSSGTRHLVPAMVLPRWESLEAFTANGVQASKLHVLEVRGASNSAFKSLACTVCHRATGGGEAIMALSCAHIFCPVCFEAFLRRRWAELAANLVDSSETEQIPCPKCEVRLQRQDVHTLTEPEVLELAARASLVHQLAAAAIAAPERLQALARAQGDLVESPERSPGTLPSPTTSAVAAVTAAAKAAAAAVSQVAAPPSASKQVVPASTTSSSIAGTEAAAGSKTQRERSNPPGPTLVNGSLSKTPPPSQYSGAQRSGGPSPAARYRPVHLPRLVGSQQQPQQPQQQQHQHQQTPPQPHRSVSLPIQPSNGGATAAPPPQPKIQQQSQSSSVLAGNPTTKAPAAAFATSSVTLTSTGILRRSVPGASEGTGRPQSNVNAMPAAPRPMPTMRLHTSGL